MQASKVYMGTFSASSFGRWFSPLMFAHPALRDSQRTATCSIGLCPGVWTLPRLSTCVYLRSFNVLDGAGRGTGEETASPNHIWHRTHRIPRFYIKIWPSRLLWKDLSQGKKTKIILLNMLLTRFETIKYLNMWYMVFQLHSCSRPAKPTVDHTCRGKIERQTLFVCK